MSARYGSEGGHDDYVVSPRGSKSLVSARSSPSHRERSKLSPTHNSYHSSPRRQPVPRASPGTRSNKTHLSPSRRGRSLVQIEEKTTEFDSPPVLTDIGGPIILHESENRYYGPDGLASDTYLHPTNDNGIKPEPSRAAFKRGGQPVSTRHMDMSYEAEKMGKDIEQRDDDFYGRNDTLEHEIRTSYSYGSSPDALHRLQGRSEGNYRRHSKSISPSVHNHEYLWHNHRSGSDYGRRPRAGQLDDDRSVFTEQIAARRAREDVEELMFPEKMFTVDDRESKDGDNAHHSMAKGGICSEFSRSRPARAAHKITAFDESTGDDRRSPANILNGPLQKAANDVDHHRNIKGTKLHINNISNKTSTTGFDVDVENFRKRLGEEEEEEDRYEEWEEQRLEKEEEGETREYGIDTTLQTKSTSVPRHELEAVVAKLKRENGMLSRQHKSDLRKNDLIRQELVEAKDTIQELKSDLHLVEMENDRCSEKARGTLHPDTDNGKLQQRIRNLEEKLNESQMTISKVNKELKTKTQAKDSRSHRHYNNSDMHVGEDQNEMEEPSGPNLEHEVRDLKRRLKDAELRAARVPTLEALLGDSKANKAGDCIGGSLHVVEDLEERVRQSKAQVVALERELAAKDRSLNSLQSKVGELNSVVDEVNDLKEKLRSYETSAVDANEVEAMLNESESAVSHLEREKDLLEVNFQEQKDRFERNIKEKEMELSKLRRELQTSRKESKASNADTEISELKREKDDVERQLEARIEAMEKAKVLIDEYEAHLQSTQSTIKRLEDALAQREQTVASLRIEIDNLKESAQREHLESGQQTTSLQNLESHIDSLKDEKELMAKMHESALNECKEKLTSLEKTLASREEVIESLRSELNVKEEMEYVNHEELEKLRTEVKNNERQISDQTSQIERLTKELDTCQGIIEEADRARDEVERLTTQTNGFEIEFDSQRREIHRLAEALNVSERANEGLEEVIEILRTELSDLETKSSNASRICQTTDSVSLHELQQKLNDAVQERDELRSKLEHQEELLTKANRMISKSNEATLSAIMNSINGKKSPESLMALMNIVKEHD